MCKFQIQWRRIRKNRTKRRWHGCLCLWCGHTNTPPVLLWKRGGRLAGAIKLLRGTCCGNTGGSRQERGEGEVLAEVATTAAVCGLWKREVSASVCPSGRAHSSGTFHLLLQELCLDDCSFQHFLRLSSDRLNTLWLGSVPWLSLMSFIFSADGWWDLAPIWHQSSNISTITIS